MIASLTCRDRAINFVPDDSRGFRSLTQSALGFAFDVLQEAAEYVR